MAIALRRSRSCASMNTRCGSHADTVCAARFTGVRADYASPEQVQGAEITLASDIFSLGVVLYRLLTDASPYPRRLVNHACAQSMADDIHSYRHVKALTERLVTDALAAIDAADGPP